jgi:hypothetical protein
MDAKSYVKIKLSWHSEDKSCGSCYYKVYFDLVVERIINMKKITTHYKPLSEASQRPHWTPSIWLSCGNLNAHSQRGQVIIPITRG